MAARSAKKRMAVALAQAVVGLLSAAVVCRATDPRPNATKLAKGQFLIANRKLPDPRFKETVVLLIEYGPGGALGLVINQRTELRLVSLLPDIAELGGSPARVFVGGPVAQTGILVLVRAAEPPKASVTVFGDVHASGSLDVLRAHAREGEEKLRAYIGYAGWAPGQLEAEVERNDWYVVPGSAADVFADDPEALWSRLIRSFEGQWAGAERLRSSGRCRASPRR